MIDDSDEDDDDHHHGVVRGRRHTTSPPLSHEKECFTAPGLTAARPSQATGPYSRASAGAGPKPSYGIDPVGALRSRILFFFFLAVYTPPRSLTRR